MCKPFMVTHAIALAHGYAVAALLV
jgi:hypothetical protein